MCIRDRFVETVASGNNATFDLAHVIAFPNTLTQPTFATPVFPFTMAAYDLGTAQNVTCTSASFGGFIEGKQYLTGNAGAWTRTLAGTVTSAAFWTLFTISNALYYNGKVNQCQIILTQITAAVDHNNPVTLYLIRSLPNTTNTLALVGNPSFVVYDATTSIVNVDESATQITFANSQVVWTATVGNIGQLQDELFTEFQSFPIQPGDFLTVCARTAGGTAPFVTASVMWREDV